MDPVTGSAALKIFGMTQGQMTNSPPLISGANGRADSGVNMGNFSTGSFNVGAPSSFSHVFMIAAFAGAALYFVMKAHR
jgi:hypothetical protein